jgi:hypothetical protein
MTPRRRPQRSHRLALSLLAAVLLGAIVFGQSPPLSITSVSVVDVDGRLLDRQTITIAGGGIITRVSAEASGRQRRRIRAVVLNRRPLERETLDALLAEARAAAAR